MNVLRFVLRVPVESFGLLPKEMFDPVFLFKLPVPFGHFVELKRFLIVALICCAFGVAERASAFLAAILAVVIFGWTYNFSFIHIADSVLATSLFALTVAPKSRNLSEHLFALRFLVVFAFFAAGYAKLAHTGLGWAKPENMVAIFQYDRLIGGAHIRPMSHQLIEYFIARPKLLSIAGYGVLAIELLSPVAFFSRRAANVIIPLTFLLFVGFNLILSQNFLQYFWPLYLYWLPWEYWVIRTRGLTKFDETHS